MGRITLNRKTSQAVKFGSALSEVELRYLFELTHQYLW